MDLLMKNISTSFGSGNVLEDVSLSLHEGEICALLGENGAGKSTLMNILGGVFPPTEGQLFIDGEPVNFSSPADSLKAGIGFIHQELNLIGDLTVCENLFLNDLPKKGLFLDYKKMESAARKLFSEIGLDLNPRALIRDLDVSYRQITEICRALLQNASIIIMDEPTTSLNAPEISRVFTILRTLKARGVSVLFISHKLNEVMEICDRYLVLRDGRVAAEGLIKDTTPPDLARFMVGHDVLVKTKRESSAYGEEVLRLEDLTSEPHFRHISLSVHRGEIFGVTGLLGDGRSELFRAVFGDLPGHLTGRIILEEKESRFTSPRQAKAMGIAYIPRNRKDNAIVHDMTIRENAALVNMEDLKRRWFENVELENSLFDKQVRRLSIKVTSRNNLIGSLSGGNQQKVVLSKWLLSRPKLLILDNPTQGVDVGAKEEIYEIIEQLANEGTAVVILSSEAQEIMRICDRTMVMVQGKNAGLLEWEEMTEEKIMIMAIGGREDEKA